MERKSISIFINILTRYLCYPLEVVAAAEEEERQCSSGVLMLLGQEERRGETQSICNFGLRSYCVIKDQYYILFRARAMCGSFE